MITMHSEVKSHYICKIKINGVWYYYDGLGKTDKRLTKVFNYSSYDPSALVYESMK